MTQDKPAECAWCGKVAVGLKMTHRPVVRKKGGVPTVIASERKAPACVEHMEELVEAEEPIVARAKYAARAKIWKGRQEKLV